MPNKCLLILLDGLGDCSHPELQGRTPLQAAHTPSLDRLAAAGGCGTYHASLAGQCLPSELAHFSIFGYPLSDFPGRGLLEALGAGFTVDTGDVVLLARLASLEENEGCLVLRQPKLALSPGENRALLHEVADFSAEGLRMRLHPLNGGGGLLFVSGGASAAVTDTNLMASGRVLPEIVPWAERAADPRAQRTARVLTAYLVWAYRTLKEHPLNQRRLDAGSLPANGIITQRPGCPRPVEAFFARTGLRAISLATSEVYWGLAAYLGMDVERCADGPDPGTDFAERLRTALTCLSNYDFVHLHTKAPDEAAHSKDPKRKVVVIEALDRALAPFVDSLLGAEDILTVVTADHSTPSAGPLIHSGETVPLLMCGTGVRRDAVVRFDEVSVCGGALGVVRGEELMLLILNALGRAKLQGVRDVPEDRRYWPGPYRPLRVD